MENVTAEKSGHKKRKESTSRDDAQVAKKGKRTGGKRFSSLNMEIKEIEKLEKMIEQGAPPRGSNPLSLDFASNSGTNGSLTEKRAEREGVAKGAASFAGAKLFDELPISDKTKKGLRDHNYVRMTAIQRASLPHSLCGDRDILGAAKTGSGKTLAFVIPVLERLYRQRWSRADGVGAIVISPTRELATQIFNEFKKAGKYHNFSAGLLIGGHKGVEFEKERVALLNVIVCTPGRLLQHMDCTPNFDCSQIQILVLDEADRILDLGFAPALNAILQNLPSVSRQTLLFSATQTKSVRDLARLSLSAPSVEYVSVHESSKNSTPEKLQQSAMVVQLQDKLNVLWSFIRTHLKSKTLVFLSSCKQVKFVYECFRRLRPGVSLRCLNGRMKQATRLAIYYAFCEEGKGGEEGGRERKEKGAEGKGVGERKTGWSSSLSSGSVMIATDVAARGLDFPDVDWVVQVDCPDDVASYIHRVGRTARYAASGRSLLLLCPSETAMLPLLTEARIPIKVTKVNPTKLHSISPNLASLLTKDPNLKYMAQRAFITYLRSIHFQSNKSVFNVSLLPHAEFALSLGLPNTPKIRFLVREKKENGEKERGVGGRRAKGVVTADEEEEGEGGERKRGKKIIFDSDEGEGEGEYGSGSGIWDQEKEEEDGEEGRESEGCESEEEEREPRCLREGEKGEDREENQRRSDVEEAKRREGGVEMEADRGDGTGEGEEERIREKKKKSKLERLLCRKNLDVLSSAYERLRAHSDSEEETDKIEIENDLRGRADLVANESEGLLFVKKRNHALVGGDEREGERQGGKGEGEKGEGESLGESAVAAEMKRGKRRKMRIDLYGGREAGRKVVFDEEGNGLTPFEALSKGWGTEGEGDEGGEREETRGEMVKRNERREDGSGFLPSHDPTLLSLTQRRRFARLREEMKRRDKEDREVEKERLRDKRRELKRKVKKRTGDMEKAGEGEGGSERGFGTALLKKEEEDAGAEEEGENGWDAEGSERDEESERVELSMLEQESLALELLTK